MFYSYTGGEHKNMLDRFLHPPNKYSKFLLLSLKGLLQKRGMGYAKIIHKKREEERRVEKMDKCPKYLKQWVLKCPPKKRDE